MHSCSVSLRISHGYFVQVAICPTMLKEPVRRPRVFFLCVRKDAAVSSDSNLLVGLLSTTTAKMHDHILCTPATSSDACNNQCSDKQAKVLRELRAQVCMKKGSQCLTADVSQSKTHIRFGLGGLCHTFAQGSKILIVDGSTNKV